MPTTCNICKKSYKTYHSWYFHNKRIHTEDKTCTDIVITYKCENCNKDFKYKSNLSRHKKKCTEKKEIVIMKNEISELKTQLRNIQPQQNILIQNNTINCILPIDSNSELYKKISYHTYKQYIYNENKEVMLSNLVSYIYTTDNLNEYKNLHIPVPNSDIIYKFNPQKNKFIKCNKENTIGLFVIKNMACIENLVYEFDSVKDYDITTEIMNKINESKRDMGRVQNDIIIIIHNASDKVQENYDKYIEQYNNTTTPLLIGSIRSEYNCRNLQGLSDLNSNLLTEC